YFLLFLSNSILTYQLASISSRMSMTQKGGPQGKCPVCSAPIHFVVNCSSPANRRAHHAKFVIRHEKDKKDTPCKYFYFQGNLQCRLNGRFRSPSQTWNVGMEIDAITGKTS